MFPKEPNHEFYKKFSDPLRAYNNLPTLYKYYVNNPDKEPDKGLDVPDHVHFAYEYALLEYTLTECLCGSLVDEWHESWCPASGNRCTCSHNPIVMALGGECEYCSNAHKRYKAKLDKKQHKQT